MSEETTNCKQFVTHSSKEECVHYQTHPCCIVMSDQVRVPGMSIHTVSLSDHVVIHPLPVQSQDRRKEYILGVTSLSLISIGFSLSLIITATQGISVPLTFSNLLVDPTSPQAILVYSFGVLSATCLIHSWLLYLPPHSNYEAFRHITFCTGMMIISTIHTSNASFKDFTSTDAWLFSIHMSGVLILFLVHPIYELLGASDYVWLEDKINLYDIKKGKGRIRYILALCNVLLLPCFAAVMIKEYLHPYHSLIPLSFSIECVMIALLLLDVWFIVMNENSIARML